MPHRVVTSRPTLLILRALGLGDVLASVPALRAIARAFPNHYRVLAAPVELAPLVALFRAIDEVLDAGPLAPVDRVFNEIDVAVNLHGKGPQSHRILLELHPKRMVAFANDEVPQTAGFPQWRPDEHEIDRWCRMLRENGIPADRHDLEIAAPRGDARSRGAIVIHPGAASESRRWPVERWIALCQELRSEGHRIVLTGSQTDFRRCRLISKALGLPIDCVLAGRTDLEELTCAIASARAIVCGDTGVAHIATALRTPSVVLFGPTSPKFWGPPPDRECHRAIWRGSLGNPHAQVVDPGLASITVSEVLEELHSILKLAHAV